MKLDQFWAMEKKFWMDGEDFFESSMAPDAHMVFPDPVGIMIGQEIIDGLRDAPRWSSVEFASKSATQLGETVSLAYHAVARRVGSDPYRALCSSTYAHDSKGWLLLAHQQAFVG